MTMTPEDRAEALRRFVPWDHRGALPTDVVLETRLRTARETDVADRAREYADSVDGMLKRIAALEARLAALEKAR